MLRIYTVVLDWIETLEPQRRRYIGALEPVFEDQCQKIIGTLVRPAVPKRR